MIKYKVIAILALVGMLLGNWYALILLIPALVLRFLITMVISWVKDEYENFDNSFKQRALAKEINELNQKLYIKILAGASHAGIIIVSLYYIYIIASKFFGVIQL